jgi:hypothetical protein
MNFLSSCVSANREGDAITFYNNSFGCLESYTDNDGRIAMILIEKESIKASLVNVYCTDDHKASYVFMENVYDKMTLLFCLR